MAHPAIRQTRLLISDLDDTLLGADDATFRFAAFVEGRRDEWLIVYNSSRFVSSIEGSMATTALPEPDLIIGGMGTQIKAHRLRSAIDQIDQRLATWVDEGEPADWGDRVRNVVANVGRVEVQPAANQSARKASFYLHNATPAELDHVASTLQSEGLKADLTYSSDRDLDVLPPGVSKATASRFVAELLGFSDDQVVVCGDSGNDLPMLTAGFRSVVVANCRRELMDLAGERIYRSSRPHADGVIEGMVHWTRQIPRPAGLPA